MKPEKEKCNEQYSMDVELCTNTPQCHTIQKFDPTTACGRCCYLNGQHVPSAHQTL